MASQFESIEDKVASRFKGVEDVLTKRAKKEKRVTFSPEEEIAWTDQLTMKDMDMLYKEDPERFTLVMNKVAKNKARRGLNG